MLDTYLKAVKKRLPFISNEDFKEFAEICNNRYSENTVGLFNSHTCKNFNIAASDFIDKIFSEKAIMIENGTIYSRVNNREELSPIIEVEEWLSDNRDILKGEMKYYLDPNKGNNPVLATYYDYAQDDCKRAMNTLYGMLQLVVSVFYNIDLGASITCRGRSMITTTGLTVESCLGGFYHRHISAMLNLIDVASNETFFADDMKSLNYTIDDIMSFWNIDDENKSNILKKVLMTKTQEQLNRIAIKNNMDRFLDLKPIKDAVEHILNMVSKYKLSFINPYKPKKLDETTVWFYIEEAAKTIQKYVPLLYGFYWYQGDVTEENTYLHNTQEVFDNMKRKSVALVDTDSNMITLFATNKKIKTRFPSFEKNPELKKRDIRFTVSNISTLIVDRCISYALELYTEAVNIPEEYRHRVALKNEYFYSSFGLTRKKKNYAGDQEIKEGVVYEKSKPDVKGLMFIKSCVNAKIGSKVEDIIVNKILRAEKIYLPAILQGLRSSVKEIKDALLSGEGGDLYLEEKLNNQLLDVLPSLSRTKSVELYNFLGVGDLIVPPSKFLTLDINIENEELFEKHPELMKKIEIYMRTHAIHNRVRKFHFYKKNDFYKKMSNLFPEADIDSMIDIVYGISDKYYKEIVGGTDYGLNIFEDFYMGAEFYTSDISQGRTRVDIANKLLDSKFIYGCKDRIKTNSAYNKYIKELEHYEDIYDNALTYLNIVDVLITEYYDKYNKEVYELMLARKNETGVTDEDIIKKKFRKIYKQPEISNFNKISIPEGLLVAMPDIILDLLNVLPNTLQIDNLAAPIIESVMLTVMRNNGGKNNISNVINYY